MRIAALILLLCGASSAAGDGTLDLLRQVSMRYLSLSSYRAKADLLREERSASYHAWAEAQVEVFWTPARERMDVISAFRARTSLSDPQVAHEFLLPAAVTSRALFYDRLLRPTRDHQGNTHLSPLVRVESSKRHPDETLSIATRRIACAVVETVYALPPDAGKPQPQRLSMKLWVEPGRFIVWKEVTTIQTLDAVSSTVTRTITFRSVDLDAPIPSTAFQTDRVRAELDRLPQSRTTVKPLERMLREWSGVPPPADATSHEAAELIAKAAQTYAAIDRIRAHAAHIYQFPGGMGGADRSLIDRKIRLDCTRPGEWMITRNTIPGRPDEVERASAARDPGVLPMLHSDIAAKVLVSKILAKPELAFAGRKVATRQVEVWYSGVPITFHRRPLAPLVTPGSSQAQRVLYWIDPSTGLVLRWQRMQDTVTYTSIEVNQEVRP